MSIGMCPTCNRHLNMGECPVCLRPLVFDERFPDDVIALNQRLSDESEAWLAEQKAKEARTLEQKLKDAREHALKPLSLSEVAQIEENLSWAIFHVREAAGAEYLIRLLKDAQKENVRIRQDLVKAEFPKLISKLKGAV